MNDHQKAIQAWLYSWRDPYIVHWKVFLWLFMSLFKTMKWNEWKYTLPLRYSIVISPLPISLWLVTKSYWKFKFFKKTCFILKWQPLLSNAIEIMACTYEVNLGWLCLINKRCGKVPLWWEYNLFPY